VHAHTDIHTLSLALAHAWVGEGVRIRLGRALVFTLGLE
jgi:hypothetical protein